MRKRSFAFVAALFIASAFMQSGVQQAQSPAKSASGYLTPPKVIVDMLDAPPTPGISIAPDRRTVALLARRSMPTLADLAEPIHRIAGARINPKTNGRQQRGGGIIAITLKSITDGTERKITVPANANLSGVSFSPDGKRLSFTNTKENGIELWVADTMTGQSKLVSGTDRLNGTTGDPCDWLKDGVTLLCQLVPSGRGPMPAAPAVPTGPNIQENYGKASPAATVQDLIKTNYDEELFDYYFTSQLAAIDSATGRKTLIGRPGILSNVTASPSGEYILISRIKRPFSRLVPMGGFPNDVEIWNRRGKLPGKSLTCLRAKAFQSMERKPARAEFAGVRTLRLRSPGSKRWTAEI